MTMVRPASSVSRILRFGVFCGFFRQRLKNDLRPRNDRELAPPQTQPSPSFFGVKLVSKYGDWAGFAGFADL